MIQSILSRTLIILSIVITFSACGSFFEEEVLLLPDDKYPAYQKGDTFFYKSILTEDIDTFLVSDFLFDTVYAGSALLEVSAAVFLKVAGDTTGENLFYISNEPGGSYFAWEEQGIQFYFREVTEPLDTVIQEYTYEDLVIAVSYPFTELGRIDKLYFDWKYGLVKYNFNDEDSYELFSRPE